MHRRFDNVLYYLSLRELQDLSLYIKNNNKEKIQKEIKAITKKKNKERKQDINYRFKLEMINTFSLEDKEVLKKNKIKNMLDLIEVNVSSLEGIDAITKESLEWAQKFYDLRGIKVDDMKSKKYIKK